MKKLSLLVLFILFGSLTLRAFFISPNFVDVHDPTAIYRISTLVETIQSGQFPAAWHNSLNYGYGYPLHLYYAPLFTYLAALISMPGIDYVLSAKLALTALTLVGSLGTYYLMRRFGRLVAVLSVVAYTFLPYHASALYVRGSYAEFAAMSLLPWVIYTWTTALITKRQVIGAALTTALFLISHNTIPFLLLPIIVFFAWRFNAGHAKNAILAMVLALLVPAAFLMPTLFERHFVQVQAIATQTKLSDHFVTFSQMWYSPWDYGGSVPGTDDRMSFMLGKGQLLLALLGILTIFLTRNWTALTLSLPLLLYLWLAHSSSLFVWQLFPVLKVIQFPWRVYGIATLALAILSGLSVTLIPPKLRLFIASLAIILLITTNDQYFKPWNYLAFTKNITTSNDNLYPLVKHKIPEYLPTWMPQFPDSPPTDGLTRNPVRVYGNYQTSGNTPLTLDTAYMPHWRLTLDNRVVALRPDNVGRVQTVANIAPGLHAVELTWHPTLLEKIGYLLSIIGLITVIGLAL